MPGFLENLRSRMTRHDASGPIFGGGGGSAGGLLSGILGGGSGSSGGGILSGSGSGGILSAHIGILNTRLATIKAATGGPVAKAQSVLSSQSVGLGAHLRAFMPAGGSTPPSNAPSSTLQPGMPTGVGTQYEISSAGRVYGTPAPPPGLTFR